MLDIAGAWIAPGSRSGGRGPRQHLVAMRDHDGVWKLWPVAMRGNVVKVRYRKRNNGS